MKPRVRGLASLDLVALFDGARLLECWGEDADTPPCRGHGGPCGLRERTKWMDVSADRTERPEAPAEQDELPHPLP